MQVVWIDVDGDSELLSHGPVLSNECCSRFLSPPSATVHVTLAPVTLEDEKTLRAKVEESEVPIPTSFRPSTTGVLESGEKYVLYRVLLYCDDFQPYSSLQPNGSAGGCYLLPIGLPPRNRRKRSSVRLIALTVPGVSTNAVLNYIVSDILKGATDGIDGYTPADDEVKIFVDVVADVADYSAAAHAIDVIDHVGSATCTHCTIQRADRYSSSNIGYTVRQHSQNTSSLPSSERYIALREARIDDGDANHLGMSRTSASGVRNRPLLHLTEQLDRARSEIPRSVPGEKAVSGIFDPYRSNVVASDHLLAGLAKNTLSVCFQNLPTRHMQRVADSPICAGLRENSLLQQNSVFDKKLHSMKLSEVYCVLLVSVPVF